MGRNTYIMLHKKEWDRICRKKVEVDHEAARNEYIKKLMEKSQSFMKTWPDTVQAHVDQLAKQKEEKRKEDMAFIKSYVNKKKHENTDAAVKHAKQLIFQNSSDGRQLLSALVESKILEERHLQIDFLAKLKEESMNRDKEELAKINLQYEKQNKQEDDAKLKKQQMETELSEINKCLHTIKTMDDAKQKAELQKEERESAQLMLKLLENEAKQEKAYDELHRGDIKGFENEQKQWRERRAEREKQDQALADAERLRYAAEQCKIQSVFREINQDKRDSEPSKKHYELIKKIQDEEKTRYEKFLEAGIKHHEQSFSKNEQNEIQTDKSNREKRCAIALANKLAGEELHRCSSKILNLCSCDRQTIICRSQVERQKKDNVNVRNNEKRRASCARPTRSLRESLKLREQEPSPWNALNATHAAFAKQAGDVLKECRYKIFARKVVDEYRKNNCLDSTSLPVANYY